MGSGSLIALVQYLSINGSLAKILCLPPYFACTIGHVSVFSDMCKRLTFREIRFRVGRLDMVLGEAMVD